MFNFIKENFHFVKNWAGGSEKLKINKQWPNACKYSQHLVQFNRNALWQILWLLLVVVYINLLQELKGRNNGIQVFIITLMS